MSILALTMRILGIIVRAIVGGSLSAFMLHGWWIIGIVVAGAVAIVGALRIKA